MFHHVREKTQKTISHTTYKSEFQSLNPSTVDILTRISGMHVVLLFVGTTFCDLVVMILHTYLPRPLSI